MKRNEVEHCEETIKNFLKELNTMIRWFKKNTNEGYDRDQILHSLQTARGLLKHKDKWIDSIKDSLITNE